MTNKYYKQISLSVMFVFLVQNSVLAGAGTLSGSNAGTNPSGSNAGTNPAAALVSPSALSNIQQVDSSNDVQWTELLQYSQLVLNTNTLEKDLKKDYTKIPKECYVYYNEVKEAYEKYSCEEDSKKCDQQEDLPKLKEAKIALANKKVEFESKKDEIKLKVNNPALHVKHRAALAAFLDKYDFEIAIIDDLEKAVAQPKKRLLNVRGFKGKIPEFQIKSFKGPVASSSYASNPTRFPRTEPPRECSDTSKKKVSALRTAYGAASLSGNYKVTNGPVYFNMIVSNSSKTKQHINLGGSLATTQVFEIDPIKFPHTKIKVDKQCGYLADDIAQWERKLEGLGEKREEHAQSQPLKSITSVIQLMDPIQAISARFDEQLQEIRLVSLGLTRIIASSHQDLNDQQPVGGSDGAVVLDANKAIRLTVKADVNQEGKYLIVANYWVQSCDDKSSGGQSSPGFVTVCTDSGSCLNPF